LVELVVELEAIRRNTEVVSGLLAPHGLRLIGVTKACLGEPRVAAAMLEGGAVALADTRDGNLRRLRCAFPRAELHRIYLPTSASPFEPGDLNYVSSVAGVRALAALRSASGGQRSGPRGPSGRLSVFIQLETGDCREGVPEAGLDGLVDAILARPELHFAGLSTNYACFAGCPDDLRRSLARLAAAVRRLTERGVRCERVSGGNSSLLGLLREGEELPGEITELRCGEALLLGHDALEYLPLPGARTDGCRLRAEVLEGYTKAPSDKGERRLVLGVGSQDLGAGELRFDDPAFYEAGRSADYLVVGVRAGGSPVEVGETIELLPTYYALSAAWTSPFVDVRLV
jgi:ornithine racemase